MSINFPDAPTTNQIHADAGVAWKWDGVKWTAYTGPLPGNVTHVVAGTGLVGGGGPDAFGNVGISLEIPVTIPHGGTSATTAAQALYNLGGFPTTGGTITGSVVVQGTLSVTSDLGVNGSEYVTGNLTVAGGVIGGYANISNRVYTPYMYGNADGNAGALQTWNTTNKLTFQYDASSGGGQLQWRIDGGAVAKFICNTSNFRDLVLSGAGGPTSTALYGYDIPGSAYGIYVDTITSDERIKDNIKPTTVDALEALTTLEVSAFDVKGPVAAWFANVAKDMPERLAAMEDAQPVHVPIGFVAQRIQVQVPEAVTAGIPHQEPEGSPMPPDSLSVVRQEMIPYLVRAIQQLADRINELKR